MIHLFSKIDKIKNELDSLIGTEISNYYLQLRLNNAVLLYVVTENSDWDLFLHISETSFWRNNISVKIINPNDVAEDEFYKNILNEAKSKINISDTRRRFSNLLRDENIEDSYKTPCPIVTFYSYKGGMGRSTTLASFATFLANETKNDYDVINKAKKVFIIDCDLEAPGFTNYFQNNSEPFYRKGLVEYLVDTEVGGVDISIRDYTWTVEREFVTGEGEIIVMPAGNLDTTKGTEDFLNFDLYHYLEGLSRLDITSPEYIVKQFKNLLDNIHKEFSPDIILVDSRTGFNDIFGIFAFRFSSLIVGFFGSNSQTLPGLRFFVDQLIDRKSMKGVAVNSILPNISFIRDPLFQIFKDRLDTIIESKITEIDDETISIPCFEIVRNDKLEILGTKLDDTQQFVGEATGKFEYYTKLFNKISELAFYEVINREEFDNDKITKLNQTEKLLQTDFSQDVSNEYLEAKKRILTKTLENWPDSYAENIDLKEELTKGRFYFRKCMENIFNADKILIIGNKGTGKSYFYKALQVEEIVSELKVRAGKTNENYWILNLVNSKEGRYSNINSIVCPEGVESIRFYRDFWRVYVWNSMRLALIEKNIEYISSCDIPVEKIQDDVTTENRLKAIIADTSMMIKIEKDLQDFDDFAKKMQKKVIIIFDDLDVMVHPSKWSERISPLINFWKRNPYSSIQPKLFVRRDLFGRIYNVTNIQDLESQKIDIEWKQDELFAYFFKLVFSSSAKDDFFKLMSYYKDFDTKIITQIKRRIGTDNNVPLELGMLRPLVETFFGKYAGVGSTYYRFGESYDWIYNNLKNADDTISLRPFLDLLNNAIIDDLKFIEPVDKPILNQFSYTKREVRESAVRKVVDDLKKDKEYKDIEKVFDTILRNKKYQYSKFSKFQFDELLEDVVTQYSDDLEYKNIEDLKDFLKLNGIVKEKPLGRGNILYSFAFLYKYYLGLQK